MKKTILTVAALLVATSSFAGSGTFTSGSVYSIGSMNPAAFKPSPNVTINYYMDGTAGGNSTDWAAFSYHKSAIGNKKGMGYWTSKSDPGFWYLKDETNGVAVTSFNAPSSSAAPSGNWKAEGQ